jgi:hypothetical protein
LTWTTPDETAPELPQKVARETIWEFLEKSLERLGSD